MTKIKIISNPYNRTISYCTFQEDTNTWEDIKQENINSKLRENDEEKIFLPFQIKEIIDTILNEYHVGKEKINIIFEGTTDEYEELEEVCSNGEIADKIELERSDRYLENARDILDYRLSES
jgi:hypothetical protein